MARVPPAKRGATTLLETTVALAVIAVLAVVVAQCLILGMRERARSATYQAALELAANVLETARAQPWDQLDRVLAKAQTIPAEMADLLPEGKILITLELGPPEPRTLRVTVEVRWQLDPGLPPQSVSLTTLLSGRMAKKAGAK
jgi:type II secretory pathway pseudopilin PulG